MERKSNIIFGPPGTGKTTKLLSILEEEFDQGTEPGRVAFVSFTRKAIKEAVQRAVEKFKFPETSLTYFRTLHSLGYRELGLTRNDIMSRRNYLELGDMLGISFSKYNNIEDGAPDETNEGDCYLYLDQLARNKVEDIRSVFHNYADDNLDWHELKRYIDTEHTYKHDLNKMDFTDILQEVINRGITLDVDVAIIDEAQDLTSLQWNMVLQIFKNVKRLYIAGDDDQCIYSWAGANVDKFLQRKGERTILNQSYRIPREIQKVADQICGRIHNRQEKQWKAREEQGEVLFYTYPDDINLSEGSWLLIARNAYFLKKIEEMVKEEGYNYETRRGPSMDQNEIQAILAWETLRKGKDISSASANLVYSFLQGRIGVQSGYKGKDFKEGRYTMNDLVENHGLLVTDEWYRSLRLIDENTAEYYRAVLRRGDSLTKPRITISTIHGVKGGEADNVMLLSDMTKKSMDNYDNDPDDEHRVFYVGATRAKERLHIISPQTSRFYDL